MVNNVNTTVNLNPPHSVCELRIELKVIRLRNSFRARLLNKDFILGAGQRVEQSNQVIMAQVQLSHDLGIT